MIVLVRPFAGQWFDQRGPFGIITAGTALYFAGIILVGLADGALLFCLGAIFIGVGYGCLQPSFQAMVIQNAPNDRRGAATATFFSSFDIGVGAGAFFLGLLIPVLGYSLMFISSSFFLICSYSIYYYFTKKQGHKASIDADSTSINV